MPNGPNDLSGRLGLETTDFKTGLASMNRELRVLESGFRASAAGLGDWAKDATGLELRIKSLNSEIDVQKNKVSALQVEYQRVAEEKGATSKAAQDLEIKLNKENETLGKMQVELGKNEKALSDMGKETEDTSKEEDQATKSTNKFSDALKGLKGKIGDAVGGLKNLVGGVAKVAGGLALGLAGAAAGAVAGLSALVVKSAATADELVETAEKMGITTTRLQELNYVAEQTGTGVDTVQSSMVRMIRSLENAEKAGTPAADAFSKLGISVRDSNGNLRDSEAVFFDAVAALGSVGNETERDVLAMELFGKSAMELNPLINLGAEGLAAMSAEANNMGAVMGEGAVTGLADFNDSLASVKAGFTGLLGTLATAFLPILNEVMEYVKTTVVPWLQENLPKAIQVLTDYWTTVLQPAIAAVWSWMSTVLIPFLQNVVFPWLQENIPKAIKTLSDFWTKTLQPALEKVWKFLTEDMQPVWEALGELLGVAIPKIIDILVAAWENVLKPALDAIWKFIQDNILPVFQSWSDAMGGIKGIIETVVGWINILKEGLSTLQLPDWLQRHSPSPFEKTLLGINTALREMSSYNLPALSRSLNGLGVSGGFGRSVSNSWSYVIQAANPLQTSGDLVRQVRLLELMHS